jgi:hypothetical protein
MSRIDRTLTPQDTRELIAGGATWNYHRQLDWARQQHAKYTREMQTSGFKGYQLMTRWAIEKQAAHYRWIVQHAERAIAAGLTCGITLPHAMLGGGGANDGILAVYVEPENDTAEQETARVEAGPARKRAGRKSSYNQ